MSVCIVSVRLRSTSMGDAVALLSTRIGDSALPVRAVAQRPLRVLRGGDPVVEVEGMEDAILPTVQRYSS